MGYSLQQWLVDTWFTVKLAAKRYFTLDWSEPNEPRQYALVRFDYDSLPEEYFESYPFKERARYIYLGEIPNFAGHCIVMDDEGKHYVGFHTENFVELSEECDEDGMSDLDRYMPVGFMVLLSIVVNSLAGGCAYGAAILINLYEPIIPMPAAYVGIAVGMAWGFYEDWRDA